MLSFLYAPTEKIKTQINARVLWGKQM